MARVWNNVTNLENIKNRTILQLLENQTKLLEEYSKEIDRIEGIAESAENKAAAAQEGVNQINARETGYGETLSISGSNLSLMHGATALSTVALPGGGGSEIVARPLTGWKVRNQTTSLDIKNAYYVPISDNIWYVCGKILHATPLSGLMAVQIIPPDAWGTPALVIGEVALGKADSYSRTLPIISQPSGMEAGVIGVVPTPAKPGGLVDYDSEGLFSFFFMAIRNAGV